MKGGAASAPRVVAKSDPGEEARALRRVERKRRAYAPLPDACLDPRRSRHVEIHAMDRRVIAGTLRATRSVMRISLLGLATLFSLVTACASTDDEVTGEASGVSGDALVSSGPLLPSSDR